VLVEEGACVFVPRGIWHATVAEQESISLDFAVDPFNKGARFPLRGEDFMSFEPDVFAGRPGWTISLSSRGEVVHSLTTTEGKGARLRCYVEAGVLSDCNPAEAFECLLKMCRENGR
jgi:hypothetical protein